MSAIGTKRTWASAPHMSAFGGRADTSLPPGDYVTLAGFILAQLHELPKPGDHLSWAGWRFEVVDMDGRRIDMILAQRHLER